MNKLFRNSGIQHVICVVFSILLFSGCSPEPQKPVETRSPDIVARARQDLSASKGVVSQTMLLASVINLAYTDPLSQSQSIPPKIVFSEWGNGVAYLAGKVGAYQVVFNGKPGRLYSDVSHLKISPDGDHIAHDMFAGGKRRMVLDGVEGKTYDDVWEPIFSPDSRHIAYIAKIGTKSYIVVDDRIISEGYDSFNDHPLFSADSRKIAYVISGPEGSARLVISDLAGQKKRTREIREEIVINREKTKIAAVQIVDKNQRVVEISFDQPDAVTEGPLFDGVDKPSYGSDGISMAYGAKKDGANYLVFNNREEKLPEAELREAPVVRPDKKGAGVILVTKDGWFFHEAFVGTGAKGRKYTEAAQLVYSKDSSKYAYCAREGKKLFVVVNGKEGPVFDMVINPVFSPDGKYLVYRARQDGKRFVVVADTSGKVLRRHPGYEMVFDTVFTADGRSVAYGVKDGQKLIWKVEKL